MNESNQAINNALSQVFFTRYPAEAVRYIEQMSTDDVAEIMKSNPIAQTLKIWERLSPQLAARILEQMPVSYAGALMEELDPNRAANILLAITDVDIRNGIINASGPGAAGDLNRAISYEPDSAGALMESRVMYFRPEMTVREVLDILRARPRRAYRKIYTVDADNHLTGVLDIEDLALADRETKLSELDSIKPVVVDVTTSREELVSIFEKYKAMDLPVVDFNQRLVGVLRYHVLLEATLEESSADLQTMVGVSKDERALSPATFAIRKRQPWLQINLATAFLAAAVVGIFEATIDKYTALAVLLPVVAGQSGNTGAQALAVTLRGLALKEIYPRMWTRIMFKEFNAGLWNGILVALTTGIAVFLWSQSGGLTMVIIFSMILSMVIAGVSGAVIPIILTVSGQDPAQSSTIFLTTITDVAGFFSFLGIASLFISML
jgi:Mg/Co/Ni transporter MgtE (contains CBS domain)